MASMKEWIKLGRPHTASLTIPGTLLGPVIAGHQDPLLYLLLGIWALGFHYFGFMHNNLCDLPHDKADPSKAHFPLVSGVIAERKAWAVWIAGTLAFYAFGIALVIAYQGVLLWSLAFVHSAILAGIGYNMASKKWRGAPALISLSFASLPVYSYFVAGGAPSAPVVWYVFAYGFFLMFHQIAYSGYLKDLGPDPVNWLERWGARAEPLGDGKHRYTFTPPVQAWGWFSRLVCVALAAAWMFGGFQPGSWLTVNAVQFLLWALPLLVVFARLSKPGDFPRQRKVALMGSSEILAYFLLVASLVPWFDALLPGQALLVALAFYVGPIVWYVVWNQALWGTWLGPKV